MENINEYGGVFREILEKVNYLDLEGQYMLIEILKKIYEANLRKRKKIYQLSIKEHFSSEKLMGVDKKM